MRGTHTIARYLAVETLLYTTLAFLAALPVILIPNVFDKLEEFAVVGVTASDVFAVLGWVLVMVGGYALPIAFVFGLMLAMGRLQGDGELTAMRSCGLGTATLVVPIAAVGLFFSIASAVVSIGLEHRAWRQIESIKRQILSRGAVIEPGRFARFGKRMILARDRVGENHFRNVMISDLTDETSPLLIFAESADYRFDAETGRLLLVLGRGDLRFESQRVGDFEEHRISFAEFAYSFPAPWLTGATWRKVPRQLSFRELRLAGSRETRKPFRDQLKYQRSRYYDAHLHRMLAVPLTPFLFALVGVPIALLGFVRSRSRGLLLAVGLLAAYYGPFVFGYDASRRGLVPSEIALWLPNALVLLAAIFLIRKTSRAPD
jgi:lipopolysaccharide export LptBFGC system permease protein LptF